MMIMMIYCYHDDDAMLMYYGIMIHNNVEIDTVTVDDKMGYQSLLTMIYAASSR